MGKLQDRVAIVTGAASGNGRGIGLRFAEEGADVVIADVNKDGMEETARLVRQQEREALTVACDVSSKADVDRLLAAAVQRFGHVDIVVANAGVAEAGADCFSMTEADWDRTININLKGVFFTLQAGANQMRAQGTGGRLIATSSIISEWGLPGAPAYAASKGGVKQLVKSFAIACGPFGITCNAIGPGFIETAMTARVNEVPAMKADTIDRTPVGRIGQPADVGAGAAFLAGDDASFVTGITVFPDGGLTAGMFSNRQRLAMEQMMAAART
jgi:glucose 1-dehydrogenase